MEYLRQHLKTIIWAFGLAIMYSLLLRSYILSVVIFAIVIYDLIKHYESWKLYDKDSN